MHGSLPSAQTPTDFVLTTSRPLTYTNTNNCSVLYHIYIVSLINCIQPDDGHSSNDRNMLVDKLYTPDQWRTEMGVGGFNPPPPFRNSGGPPKSCQTQPDFENC